MKRRLCFSRRTCRLGRRRGESGPRGGRCYAAEQHNLSRALTAGLLPRYGNPAAAPLAHACVFTGMMDDDDAQSLSPVADYAAGVVLLDVIWAAI
jgi:hypothetical protein